MLRGCTFCCKCGNVMQAVKCRQGKCEGYLVEKREDNLSSCTHWDCTECSRSVPSFLPSGTSPQQYPEPLTATLRHSWEQAMGVMQTKVGCSPDICSFCGLFIFASAAYS